MHLMLPAMSMFPVSSSILSANHLNVFLQGKYNLARNATCSLIKAGINHSYLIHSGEKKYIFRVYSLNWRTDKEIIEEIRLTNLLKENNISVSFAIKDLTGNYIQSFSAPEGNRPGVMFSWAEGEKSLNFSSETHFKVGETMALIHKNTLNLKLNRETYTPQALLIDSFEILKQFLSVETAEMTFMGSVQKLLLEELAKADLTKLRHGAVLLDIWFDNLHLNAKDEITIFDFDFCGNGWLCLDIAYYLLQLFVLEPDKNEHRMKMESFLNGYESITKISMDEKRLLPTLGLSLHYFYLGIQCRRFENWSNVFINETYLKRYIEVRIKKYYEHINT